MAKNSPCYKCDKRYPGCHGKCNIYQLYSKNISVINRGNDSLKNDLLSESSFIGCRRPKPTNACKGRINKL